MKTKLVRRFVYNSETNESFWRISLDVMKGVVEFDRQEREKRTQEHGEIRHQEKQDQAAAEIELATALNGIPTAAPAPGTSLIINQNKERPNLDSDGEEYEEVEVTDDEDDENPYKRQKTEGEDVEQMVEFNEDDIEF